MQSEEVDENEKQVLIIFITWNLVILEGISENFFFQYLNTSADADFWKNCHAFC